MKLLRRRRHVRTGNPVDDDLLARIQAKADLHQPRHWTHYLYVADESTARAAADEVLSDGWDLDRVEPVQGSRGWVVVAEQHDAVLSPDRVAAARRFFESLADRCRGGDYGGWQTEV
ncbi:ribonuclease E inhibitor RraB [Nocardioides marmorisolisilvae]|uniref:Ribonuclease E inhibitor RraB n=1 Tax=Nocardioides marmorisolisilvae TaxID=1542737 RepID=A0A3N0DWI6_9ACTN|nr:ribonuclease E inhibitor RraB [Nocardioides marmorisolisilvae]RNL79911.1 ribonuclease E inhibitor RraB [Nocardioides marmorisolisilvae]